MQTIVYILQFERSGKYYVGSTSDISRRLKQHSAGHTASTRSKGAFILVFTQSFNDSVTPRCVERKIKNWKRRDFIEKIIADGKMRAV